MMCKIYRSEKKNGLYVYLAEDKKLSDLPDKLITMLGKNTKVMELDLNSRDKLANENIEKVKANLLGKGYHLQFPNDIVKNLVSYK